MGQWTAMTIRQMVAEFRNLFSVAELREQLVASEEALADYERMSGLHRRRKTAILLLLKEREGDGNAD